MNYLQKIIGDFEIHSVEGIKNCFENGVNPNLIFDGKPLIYALINMYFRSPNFKNCIKVFVDFGLEFEDKAFLYVLLDDAVALETLIAAKNDLIFNKYTLDCTFTPLFEASLLHICAEYNHLACAKVLVNFGANCNEKAGLDANGFGGQTPVFHSVNQHSNNSIEMLKYLVSLNCDLKLTVKGLIWGKGYDWETFIPSVNPISYAMMGLLPQFQRKETQIYEVIAILLQSEYGIDYLPKNIPNRYLYG